MPVALRPQAWKLLLALAQCPGSPLGKQHLLDRVWPGLVVTEDSLVQAVGDIRQALGTRGRDLLRTLPRRGYMLVPDPPARNTAATTTLEHAATAQSLGDRLRQQAARRFTGRDRELLTLRPAVARHMPAQPLFFVHGPGGIGKSSLLEQLRLLAEPAVEVVALNSAEILPTPEGVIDAMGSAPGLNPALAALLIQHMVDMTDVWTGLWVMFAARGQCLERLVIDYCGWGTLPGCARVVDGVEHIVAVRDWQMEPWPASLDRMVRQAEMRAGARQ